MNWVAALALVAQPLAGPAVTEVPTKSDNVVMSVFVRAPKALTDREQAAWWVFAESLYESNQNYTSQDIVLYGSQAGKFPLISASDQLIEIRFVGPKGSTKLLAELTEGMLRRPRITNDLVAEASRKMQAKASNDLTAWFRGNIGRYDRLTALDVRDTWSQVVRPENVSFAVSQQTPAGSAKRAILDVFTPWKTFHYSPRPSETTYIKQQAPGYGSIAGMGWSPLVPSEENAPKFLALTGLGVGVSCPAFQIARQEMGQSYLQQTLFLVGKDGFRPWLAFAGSEKVDLGQFRKRALEVVSEWTDADLVRAKGVFEACLKGEFEMNPFYLHPGNSGDFDEEARVTWAAYSQMVGGLQDPDRLIEAANKVTLEQFKETASNLLSTGIDF